MMNTANAQRHDHGLPGQQPRGLGIVLAEQRTGFWSRPGSDAAQPEFSDRDIPSRIYTFEPWLGCLWGKSCEFCYVPNLSVGHYPGGRASPWFQDWGGWLVPKPRITERLRDQLLDSSGRTRPKYRGAFVFMSAKTDPLLLRHDLLVITRSNLAVFADADVFLMCQTRSPAVVEDKRVFTSLVDMAVRKKAAVSFSISTDIKDEQRRVERGGLSPDRRLRIMETLKRAGVFVSAAVSPLMPYSSEFPDRLVESAHHASIQALRPPGLGSATPRALFTEVGRAVPNYEQLEAGLVEHLRLIDTGRQFAWGVGNKGFMGAFLAARRYYGSENSGKKHRQLTFGESSARPEQV